jgi:endonuclease/exonuclease/phosphatase family metal-dependent hydrolase
MFRVIHHHSPRHPGGNYAETPNAPALHHSAHDQVASLKLQALRAGANILSLILTGLLALSARAELPPELPYQPAFLSLLTYNVQGNGVQDWTTNAPQVQAIGRKVAYLKPDIISFQEIPRPHRDEMTNFVTAFLPGYHLARFSGTDGYVQSAVASRFPITRSQRWLQGSSLAAFGYDGRFTRDLFEVEIAVPEFEEPLHLFTAHLKALSDANSAARRAAEAGAISNFLVTAFLTTNAHRPYVLAGDLNEDILRPPATSLQPIQRLVNPATGLRPTTPRNPFTNDERTWSIQAAALSVRFDYILPGGLLFSNIAGSQVFRTDLLAPTPPGIEPFDSRTASDHLPVLMLFHNPYDREFPITSVTRHEEQLTLEWRSTVGRQYLVETSSNLVQWTTLTTIMTAQGTNFIWSTDIAEPQSFFRVRRR